jgi:hypothetical protein
MRIPEKDDERLLFVMETIQKCMASLETRRADYKVLRCYYLQGNAPDGVAAPYNQIFPHLDQLSSFLYSSETTKFSAQTGATFPPTDFPKISPITRLINDVWLESDADQVFSLAMNWALVYNTTLIKLVVDRGEILPYMVEPGMFGVLREDIQGLSNQEAVCFRYYVTKGELWGRYLKDHPNGEAILAAVSFAQANKQADYGDHRMLISAVSTNSVTGQAPMIPNTVRINYTPEVAEETIEMNELWVRDDKNGYNVFTVADPFVVIFDRPGENLFLKDELPFIQICPNPLPGYFWGSSEVDRLAGLQDQLSERMRQVWDLLKQQVSPPTSFSGFVGAIEELMNTFNTAGGAVTDQGQGQGKVTRFAPSLPDDLFKEIREIREMFGEQSGITPVLAGRGESGVRSQGHAQQLGRLGSSRPKKRALVIESALERMATLYLRLLQKYTDVQLKDEKGENFIPAQFPRDCAIKVDAHSNSPIFTEDTRELAFEMFKAKVIDGEDLLDLVDPPKKDLLKQKLKEREAKIAAQQAQQKQQAPENTRQTTQQ